MSERLTQPLGEKPEPKLTHVDDFIRFPPEDDAGRYAAFCLMLFRLPSVMKWAFAKWTAQYVLFCTYKGERYRVTGASRLGDVWLAKNHKRDSGYDLRVNIDDCTEWGSEAKPK